MSIPCGHIMQMASAAAAAPALPFTGQVAIITGGAQGIGFGIAK
jgi:hypothetical protein